MRLKTEISKPRLLIFTLLVIFGVFAWAVAQRLRPEVQVGYPSRGEAVEAVYATGVVEPVYQAKIGPLSAARILKIVKRDGDPVKSGEVLAQLDGREAVGNLEQQAARRDYLRDEIKRQQTLVDKGFVSASSMSKLVFDLKQADAALASSRRPLAETVLRAPIDGIVLRQDGEAGEMASVGQALFWVGSTRPLRVSADVDEEDILRVKPGQKALLKADGLNGQILLGRVQEITEKGDSLNKNYRVRLSLPEDTPLKIGMTVEVNIIIDERQNALLVPSASVKGDQIWRVVNGILTLVPVKIGVRGQDRTEILSGINLEDTIVVSPVTGLKMGQVVRSH
jgi:RND family efflux transporter MFP subunit